MFFLKFMAIVFISRMIWAIYNDITFIRKLRAKRNYKDATLNITEKVIPERIIEPSTWILTLILDTGRALLVILIMFILFIRARDDSVVFHANDFFTFLVVSFLCFLAVWVSGYLSGALIARGVQNYFSNIRHISLSEQGILYGGRIMAWDHFRGYLVFSKGPYIHVLSKYYPAAIGFSFAPTSKEDFDLIIGEIRRHLPHCDLSLYEAEIGFFANVYFQAVFLSLVLLVIELTGFIVSIAMGIILNSLLMYLHITISQRIINRIVPTGKMPVAEIA